MLISFFIDRRLHCGSIELWVYSSIDLLIELSTYSASALINLHKTVKKSYIFKIDSKQRLNFLILLQRNN